MYLAKKCCKLHFSGYCLFPIFLDCLLLIFPDLKSLGADGWRRSLFPNFLQCVMFYQYKCKSVLVLEPYENFVSRIRKYFAYLSHTFLLFHLLQFSSIILSSGMWHMLQLVAQSLLQLVPVGMGLTSFYGILWPHHLPLKLLLSVMKVYPFG